jgi:hypothetical protein
LKRPAFQFYPADWRKDAALQSCSVAAQGLWINILCIAHECDPYGHLRVNCKPMNSAQIGRLVGISQKEADKLLAELSDSGVTSIAVDGALFSRRMVRDEELRNIRAAGGKAGAEHGVKGAEHGVKGGRTPTVRGVIYPPLEPPPSSSSSSSTSINTLAPTVLVGSDADEPESEEKTGLPKCPHEKLLSLWAKRLPHLTQPRVWEGQRRVTMRNRWCQAAKPSAYSPEGYATDVAGVAWWDSFFAYIANDTRLSGGWDNQGKHWQPSLEWVCGAANFQKIIDGNYNK